MSETTIIARPYAKAVFDLAQETDTIAHWEQMLSVASEAVSNTLFFEYIRSPLYSKVEKVSLFTELFVKVFDASFYRLLNMMASFDRLWVFPAL